MLQQITVNLRAAVPPPKCQYFRGKSRSFTVYVSKMNFYFIGLIFRVIRNVCLFPGRLEMRDSYNKTRAGRFPEVGERKALPACLELLCARCPAEREKRAGWMASKNQKGSQFLVGRVLKSEEQG